MKTRLLYLGFAFPPGMQALFPGINPAGHAFETRMAAALRAHFEMRSVGVLPERAPVLPADADPASGVPHELLLLEKPPELLHRVQSLARLRRQYLRWLEAGWAPEVVLVYNLSPIYNSFIRWLRKRGNHPKLVLLLLDSSHLGKEIPRFKQFRYRFKPMVIPDAKMIGEFDACVGLSQTAERFFVERKLPFLWMPGACAAEPVGARPFAESLPDGPIRFGYFGSLAPYSGVMPLLELFLGSPLPNGMHVCGHGKLSGAIAELCRQDSRLHFHGLLPDARDCTGWAREHCDVLINPRPASHGNENNFPSKIFDYALCGRAILTSRLGGVDQVLGPEAHYFETEDFPSGLLKPLELLAQTPRAELRRQGNALQERVTSRYSWPKQAAAMADFIMRLP